MLKIDFKSSTVDDCKLLNLPRIQTKSGSITSLNNSVDIPFDINRVYYLYDVPGGAERGGHAHYDLYQVIVAASGSFDVIVDDGNNQKTISLNRPYHGLLIVPGIWRELINFSSGSTCLVMASATYSASDYIRDIQMFYSLKSKNS
ncbi:MAG: FdtA/QdtA family cupin domain-containing protein [Bacteroidota bacterium]